MGKVQERAYEVFEKILKYKKDDLEPTLSYIKHAEGYAKQEKNDVNAKRFEYYLKKAAESAKAEYENGNRVLKEKEVAQLELLAIYSDFAYLKTAEKSKKEQEVKPVESKLEKVVSERSQEIDTKYSKQIMEDNDAFYFLNSLTAEEIIKKSPEEVRELNHLLNNICEYNGSFQKQKANRMIRQIVEWRTKK